MEVPLIVIDFIDEKQEQFMSIWRNSKNELVRPPHKPYFMASEPIEYTWRSTPDMTFGIKGRRLSTGEECKFFRYNVRNTGYVKRVNMALEKKLGNVLLENHVMFPWRILIDSPDFYSQYPNTDTLKVGIFDCEMRTEKHFWATPVKDPIIALSINDITMLTEDDTPDADEEICHKFVEIVSERDFDILAGQNIRDYDIPYIFGRCKKHGIDISELSRTGTTPVIDKRGRNVVMKIGGRIVYDTFFHGIAQDQTLYGVKQLRGAGGQKAVLQKWGYDPIELGYKEIGNTYKLINTERIKKYVESDREGAQTLFTHYFYTTQQVAEYLKTPLNFIIDYTSIFIPSIVQGRDMLINKTFSDGSNRERHKELTWSSTTYQAAVTLIVAECLVCKKVFLYGTGVNRCPQCHSLIPKQTDKRRERISEGGLFPKINKIDFSGYYDTIQRNFNLSPSTTRIIGYSKYPETKFEFSPPTTCEHKGDNMILHVPDDVINKTVNIEVELNKESHTVNTLEAIKELRTGIKTNMKKVEKGTPKYEHLYSQQNALKIVNKTFSGCNANAGMRYGDIGVSIAIVGIARTGIIFVIDYLREKYGIESIAEVDTDGVYTSQDIDNNNLNSELSSFVSDNYGIKNILYLDEDNYGAGYFAMRKVYMLEDMKGEIIVKGNAFKSSSKPLIFDKILKQAGKLKLRGEGDKFKGVRFSDFELEDFIKSKTLKMEPNQYLQPESTDVCEVARQAEMLGMPVVAGNRYFYMEVKNKHSYEYTGDAFPESKGKTFNTTHKLLQLIKDRSEIDFGHYRAMLNKMLLTLRMLKIKQKDLSRWTS